MNIPVTVRIPVTGQQPAIAPIAAPQPVGGVTAPSAGTTQGGEGVILQLGQSQAPQSGLYGADGRLEQDRNLETAKASMKEQNEPCQACSDRKYQDGSDDPGVSFKAATNISPEAAGALVRAHEQEHVSHAQAEAQEKDMNVQSSVVIHTDICPECKRIYVAGGTTYTRMSSKPQSQALEAYGQQAGAS